jgi:membrane protein YqaA with SNARE-associated domain
MTEYFLGLGYFGLFILSFLSATVLPASSEIAVVFLLSNGYQASLIILCATFGNYLGSLTNYYLGSEAHVLLGKRRTISRESLGRAVAVYKKWGAPTLFFSWLPLIGDPLTIVGGLMRVSLLKFSFWVLLGKLFRYLLLLWAFERFGALSG